MSAGTRTVGEKKKIGELLIDAEAITAAQLKEALAIQKQEGAKIVEILISLGYLDVESVAKFLSQQPGIPSIELSNYQVSAEVCNLIPREFALENEVFPIDKLGKLLTVGMAFPLDSMTIARMEEATGLKVKALLCRSHDIKNAIERYYGADSGTDQAPDKRVSAEHIETGARLGSIANLIRNIDKLPTMPSTVQRVQEASNSENTDMKDIAAIISEDPALCANILQLVNSASFGLNSRIDNIESATKLLGLEETCMVALSSAVIDLTKGSSGFDHARFWKESTFCAGAARAIAAACEGKENPGIYTAALLCDIGRFALSEAAPGRYGKIDKSLLGESLKAAEEKIFGIGHPEAGYILATHWQFPDEIALSIRFHEMPQSTDACEKHVAIVSLAAYMTELSLRGEDATPGLFDMHGDTMASINIMPEDAVRIYEECLSL